ncbi:hypothetical protein COCNU_04G015530 [Cocos nucifera]|uniref:Uncharacterized protein n=1 Tax=Cocos nucifera TaxID=13894 RepID=A0A8K0N105_COCNU|nr:hypothetical protein COCNU_04G015530 [Cocos nucifera]
MECHLPTPTGTPELGFSFDKGMPAMVNKMEATEGNDVLVNINTMKKAIMHLNGKTLPQLFITMVGSCTIAKKVHHAGIMLHSLCYAVFLRH